MSTESHFFQEVSEKSTITLDNYMYNALHHPKLGYYTQHHPFGVYGDFTTSPEISQVFGELIGLWIVDIWQKLGSPSKLNLVELGPGRATLMKDICRASKLVPEFLKSCNIHFIELSPNLHTQDTKLNIQWHQNIETVPEAPSIIIANEFFDALPIKQYIKTKTGWAERHISIENQKLIYQDLSCALPQRFLEIGIKAKTGDIIEFCPQGNKIIDICAEKIAHNTGAMLIVDYGYTKSNFGNSLQAIKNHNFSNPLRNPGHSDISTHVNFEHLQQTVERDNIISYKPISQRDFLTNIGIRERFQKLKENCKNKNDETNYIRLCTEQDRLISIDQMGLLFKVFCFSSSQVQAAGLSC